MFIVGFAPVGKAFNGEAAMREDVQMLRSLPGVVAATAINAVPLSGGGSASVYFTEPGEKGVEAPVNYFAGGRARARARSASSWSKAATSTPAIVTQAARNSSDVPAGDHHHEGRGQGRCSPDSRRSARRSTTALSQPARVVGIVEHMHGSWPSWDKVEQRRAVSR